MPLPPPRDPPLSRLLTIDQLDALLPDDEPSPEPGDFCVRDSRYGDDDDWSDAA